jgi:serine/threonine protein kinase
MILAVITVAMLATMIPVEIGEVVAGKYRIDRVIGAGGMGVVVAAEHIQLRQIVAIKFVRADALGSSEGLERFLREARAVVRLRSEHVARVIDVGALANGTPFMVMEFLLGSTLSALLDEASPLPIGDVVHYVIQACEALAEAHSLGIIHRDLKPENLFLTHSVSGAPLVKVLDFGVSKMESTGGTRGLTRTAALVGSPLYMAPEQMRSARAATARSDIWALGVVLYDLLTHTLPFDAESMPELCLKVTLEPPHPLRVRRPEIPPALEGVIMRCLEKDPARRYANAAELALALAPFAPPEASGAVERAQLIATGVQPPAVLGDSRDRPPLPAPYVSRASTPRTTTQDQNASRAPKRRYGGIIAAVATTALVVGVTVPLIVAHLEPDERPAAPDATPVLQNASVAVPSSSTTGTIEIVPVPSSAAVPTGSPPRDAAAPRPAGDAGRAFPRPRPTPPPSAPPPATSQPVPPGRHDDIPTMR